MQILKSSVTINQLVAVLNGNIIEGLALGVKTRLQPQEFAVELEKGDAGAEVQG